MPDPTVKIASFGLIVAGSRALGTRCGDYNYPPVRVLKNVLSGTAFAQSTNRGNWGILFTQVATISWIALRFALVRV